MENVKYKICYWYHEYQDMSASVPTCDYYRQYGECPCEPECKHFITKREVDDIVRNMGKTGQTSDLISRQDALEAFGLSEKTRKYNGDHSGYDTMMKYEIQDVLENLPSAETEYRHYIKIYADDEPFVKAEKLYQICGETQSREVAEWLKEYFPLIDTEWIPCSERLPSEYGEYLATVDGETIEVSYVPRTKGLINGWSTCDTYGYKRLSDDDVIAWRPLPRPYKESEVEE